jgi:molybdopterin converting factor small subunit
MKVKVKLFAQYRDGRFREEEMELPEGTTVAELIEKLELPVEKLPIGILLMNGRHVTPETPLEEGVTLSIFPKIGGG